MKLNFGLSSTTWNKITKYSCILFLTSLAFTLTSCTANLPTWISEAEQIIPVAVQIVTGLLSLIGAFNGLTISSTEVAALSTVASDTEAALNDLESLVNQYNAEPSTSLLSDIQNAASLILANLKKLMNDVNITDTATQQKITAVAQLVYTEISSWALLIPVLSAAQGQTITLPPQFVVPYDKETLKQKYNEILNTPTGDAKTDEVLTKAKHL